MSKLTIVGATVYAAKPQEYQGRYYAKGDQIVVSLEEQIRLNGAGLVTERYPFGLEPAPQHVRYIGGRRFVRSFISSHSDNDAGSFVDEESHYNWLNARAP